MPKDLSDDDLEALLGPDPAPALALAGLAPLRRWVAWRPEVNPKTGKVARSPRDLGRKAASDDPSTWGTRAEAEFAAARLGAPAHVGLILGPSAPGPLIGGLDLDGCRDPATGVIAPWAAAIIATFETYSELSPSGTGAKLFFKYAPADLDALRAAWGALGSGAEWGPRWPMGEHVGPELHLGGRWYAVTSQALPGSPLEPRPVSREALLELVTVTGPALKAGGRRAGERPSAEEGHVDRSAVLWAIALRMRAAGENFEAFTAAVEADPAAWGHVVDQARSARARANYLNRQWKRAGERAPAPIDPEAEFEERGADPLGALPDRVERVERERSGGEESRPAPEWVRNARGAVVWCHANAETILRSAPAWRGVLAFDEFTNKIMLTARIPGSRGGNFAPREIRDADFAAALGWLNRHGFPDATDSTLRAMVDMVARETIISPVRHYLEDLRWDGTPRLDSWLTDYCGVEATPYSRAVGRAWMISAVARALRPGCKADHMLILEGPQGLGKSSLLAALCGPEWFSDSLPDMHSKDASIALRGKWVLEVGELSAMRRSDIEVVKAFISRQEERYRPPYGRAEVVEPRRCVFAGTVNPGGDGYLLDDTGNRRSWPVTCTKADVAGIEGARAQLWAEAVAAFKAGEVWHLDRETEALARAEQAERVETDPWASAVLRHAEEILATPRGFLDRGIATGAILERLGFDLRAIGKTEAKRVGGVLVRGGWRREGRFKARGHPFENAWRFTRDDLPEHPPPDPFADADDLADLL